MNKKSLCLSVLPISVLLISCDNSNAIDEDIYSTNEYTTEVANLMVNYETTLEPLNDFTLKGYEDSGIKKETEPTTEPETEASVEIINY